jgi:hypothetical protein
LGADMSYFDRVIDQVMQFNPISAENVRYAEKRRKEVLQQDKKDLEKLVDEKWENELK